MMWNGVENAYHLWLTLDAKTIAEFREQAKDAKHLVDICLELDGERIEMTYEEFKSRLTAAAPFGPFSSASALNLNESENTASFTRSDGTELVHSSYVAETTAEIMRLKAELASRPAAPSAEVEAACTLLAQIAEPMAEQADLLTGTDRKLMDSLVDRTLGIAVLLRRLAETPKAAPKRCPHYWDTHDNGCLLAEGHDGPHSFADTDHTVSATAGGDAEWSLDKLCEGDPVALIRIPRAVLRKLRRERDEGAGWLAQIVIDKHGGTDDLPAWVRRSAQYYADVLALAEQRGELLAKAEKDAERYRWLRDPFGHDAPWIAARRNNDCAVMAGAFLDEAIDAALSREPAQEGK